MKVTDFIAMDSPLLAKTPHTFDGLIGEQKLHRNRQLLKTAAFRLKTTASRIHG
jgi:hypothetical protein